MPYHRREHSGHTVILSDQVTMLRGVTVKPLPPVWAVKDPSVDVVREADFCRLLGRRTIQSVVPGYQGVTVLSGAVRGSIVSLSLRGGIDGVPARVELKAICTDGTGEVGAIVLPIIAQITLTPGDAMPATQPITTTDATPGVLMLPPLLAAVGASLGIVGQVLARNTITGDTMRWDVAATAKLVGTVNCAIVNPRVLPDPSGDPAMLACSLAFASGANPSFVVSGFTGSIIIWEGSFSWAVA